MRGRAIGLGILAWLVLARGEPITEAERSEFDLTRVTVLGKKEAKKASALFKKLKILGKWHSNASFLLEMNQKLVHGEPVFIDGFLDQSIADNLRRSIQMLGEEGSLRHDRKQSKPSIEQTGLDMAAYARAANVSERCELLGKPEFEFRHHDWEWEEQDRELEEYPSLLSLAYTWRDEYWKRAWNLLLSGSGYRISGSLKERMEWVAPVLRDWMPGDYSLLHHDFLFNRVLSMNIWLATENWKMDWGGNFLWCGPPPYSSAVRVHPLHNRAAIFIPHHQTWHAVEDVKASDPSEHRFSLTGFLMVDFESMAAQERHAGALQRHQEALREEL